MIKKLKIKYREWLEKKYIRYISHLHERAMLMSDLMWYDEETRYLELANHAITKRFKNIKSLNKLKGEQ